MDVRPDTVVRLEYVLRVDGDVVDATPEGETVSVLYGHATTLPTGLEGVLLGREPGPFREVVPPELGAGRHDPAKVMAVGREELPAGSVEVGEQFYAQDEKGSPVTARVVGVEGERVILDTNPEFAGKALEYTGVIHDIREATPGEISHGHVHGEGGVQH